MQDKKEEKKEKVSVRVAWPPYAEGDKSWLFLTRSSHEENAWTDGFWFPKSVCSIADSDKESVRILTMPKWLHKKNFKK